MPPVPPEITALLLRWSEGDQEALDCLLPQIYPELRRIARHYMAKENSQHTLQTSALINEAYLRLVDGHAVQWQSRGHFFAVAAHVMRHILIDHARRYRYGKRGAGATHLALDDVSVTIRERAAEFIALDEALDRLAQVDARKSQLVELRFFGGMTVEETAEVMKISPITVKREWRAAKAWLSREIIGAPDELDRDT